MVRRKVVMSRDPKLPLCQWSEASNRKVKGFFIFARCFNYTKRPPWEACRQTISERFGGSAGPPKRNRSAGFSRSLNHSHFPDSRAHVFAVLANIGVLLAGRAQNADICSHLRVALLFAQQPTGLKLPFTPKGTRFPPVPGGEFAPLGENIS